MFHHQVPVRPCIANAAVRVVVAADVRAAVSGMNVEDQESVADFMLSTATPLGSLPTGREARRARLPEAPLDVPCLVRATDAAIRTLQGERAEVGVGGMSLIERKGLELSALLESCAHH